MNFDVVLLVAEKNRKVLADDFLCWLPDNEQVWHAFVHEVSRVRARGFKHYSSKTIIHFLRHHTNVAETDSEWKINNNHSPYVARLYDLCYPEHAGLWSYRVTPKTGFTSPDETFDPHPLTKGKIVTKEINVVQIQTALLVPITGQFIVDKLGIQPVRKEKRAMYWRAEDFTNICQALIQHITAARNADFSVIAAKKTASEPAPAASTPSLFDDADDAIGGEVEDFFA